MARYWVIAPIQSNDSNLFDKVWQFDLANNVISIGWYELGDVTKMTHDMLADAVASKYPDKPPQTKGLFVDMLWGFYHEATPGDFVIARRGRKTLAAIGKVTRTAFYTPGKNPSTSHPGFLQVEWQDKPRDKVFPDLVFPMHTLTEISETQCRNLLDGSGAEPITTQPTEAIEDPNAFVLEKVLGRFHRH